MAADYTYDEAVVLIEATADLAIGATGVLRPVDGGDPVQVFDLNGSALPHVLVGPFGVHQPFRADIPQGLLDFGSKVLVKESQQQREAGLEAKAIALDAAANASTALTLIGALSPGGGSGGSNVVYGTNVDATNLPDGTIVVELPEGTV